MARLGTENERYATFKKSNASNWKEKIENQKNLKKKIDNQKPKPSVTRYRTVSPEGRLFPR